MVNSLAVWELFRHCPARSPRSNEETVESGESKPGSFANTDLLV